MLPYTRKPKSITLYALLQVWSLLKRGRKKRSSEVSEECQVRGFISPSCCRPRSPSSAIVVSPSYGGAATTRNKTRLTSEVKPLPEIEIVTAPFQRDGRTIARTGKTQHYYAPPFPLYDFRSLLYYCTTTHVHLYKYRQEKREFWEGVPRVGVGAKHKNGKEKKKEAKPLFFEKLPFHKYF